MHIIINKTPGLDNDVKHFSFVFSMVMSCFLHNFLTSSRFNFIIVIHVYLVCDNSYFISRINYLTGNL